MVNRVLHGESGINAQDVADLTQENVQALLHSDSLNLDNLKMCAKKRRLNLEVAKSDIGDDDNFDMESVLIKISDHIRKEKAILANRQAL